MTPDNREEQVREALEWLEGFAARGVAVARRAATIRAHIEALEAKVRDGLARCDDCHEPAGASPVCQRCAGLRTESVADAVRTTAEARVRELVGDARAWRNRFISERTSTYRGEGHGYEMATAKAEADANDYIDAFHAIDSAMQGEEVRGG